MLMTEVLAYTPEEVARRLRVSEETVRREIRSQRLGALQVGKQYRIAASDLIAYLGAQRFEEWFGTRSDLRAAIGSGDLPEEEAHALAWKAVSEVRAKAKRSSASKADSNAKPGAAMRQRKQTGLESRPTGISKKSTQQRHRA